MVNFDKTIDTLCFSGGGTKGLVFIGSVKALIDKNIIILQNIKKFIGTSAGSIISFLLSINYTPEEIEDFVLNFDFKKLEPDPSCENLFTNFGLDDGKKLEYLLSKLLYFKLKTKKITFGELFDKTNNELIISATCINTNKSKYFNYKFTPDDDVILALKMSVAVPFYFYPVYYEGYHYIDGGILDNYPIQLGNIESTLGLAVISDKYNQIDDFGDYMIKVIKLILNANLINKIKYYKNSTIGIISSEKNFIDLKMNNQTKKIMIDRGYNKVIKEYNYYIKHLTKNILADIIDKISENNETENNESIDNESIDNETENNESIDNETENNESIDNESIDNETGNNESIDNESRNNESNKLNSELITNYDDTSDNYSDSSITDFNNEQAIFT